MNRLIADIPGVNVQQVTSKPPLMTGYAGCLQGQDRSAVTYPSSSHGRRCLIWLSSDNHCTRYTAPLLHRAYSLILRISNVLFALDLTSGILCGGKFHESLPLLALTDAAVVTKRVGRKSEKTLSTANWPVLVQLPDTKPTSTHLIKLTIVVTSGVCGLRIDYSNGEVGIGALRGTAGNSLVPHLYAPDLHRSLFTCTHSSSWELVPVHTAVPCLYSRRGYDQWTVQPSDNSLHIIPSVPFIYSSLRTDKRAWYTMLPERDRQLLQLSPEIVKRGNKDNVSRIYWIVWLCCEARVRSGQALLGGRSNSRRQRPVLPPLTYCNFHLDTHLRRSLTSNLGINNLKVTSEPPPMVGQAGCLQGQDRSAVTHPSSSHSRRCLIRLSRDNRPRYTASSCRQR
ncbi:hypothetical protein J6590_049237 [Homalodisca vitripennis]|nr:hypothetical protein J6590_049237 [Homalodisca vitripennis]